MHYVVHNVGLTTPPPQHTHTDGSVFITSILNFQNAHLTKKTDLPKYSTYQSKAVFGRSVVPIHAFHSDCPSQNLDQDSYLLHGCKPEENLSCLGP